MLSKFCLHDKRELFWENGSKQKSDRAVGEIIRDEKTDTDTDIEKMKKDIQ